MFSSIIIFILVLAVLVLTHELGHFIVAKKAGIRVDEFGFGFPPRLFSFKKGETIYSFNLIPFGGFVRIFGENVDEEAVSGKENSRSMVNKPRWIQAGVLSAGVLFNVALAWIFISFNLFLGMPVATNSIPAGVSVENVKLLVTSVLKDSPAEKAGLRAGDNLITLKFEETEVTDLSAEDVQKFISNHGNKELSVIYERALPLEGGVTTTVAKVIPVSGVVGESPAIGITMEKVGLAKVAPLKALWVGIILTYQLTISTVIGFGYFFSSLFTEGRSALMNVAGPIGLFSLVGDASRLGIVYLLNFVAIISINLAVINLLPFPALDGGRLFILLIEKIKGSRLNPKIVNGMNLAGFIFLILLMFLVSVSDVAKLI